MFKEGQNSQGTVLSRLSAKADKLAQWHRSITFFEVIDRLVITRAVIGIALLFGLLAAYANFEVRQSQYQVWQDNKNITFLDDTPLFSTTDASYFLALARQYNETGDRNDFENKRLFPNNQPALEDAPARDSLFDFPLLSVLIASLTDNNSTSALLQTGNALIPLLGFVMALGILLAFGASGFWLEGAVAAIGAGLAPTFLARSSIGRIDTDILNLGFFYAVIGLSIYAARAKTWRNSILLTIVTGLCLFVFLWWYSKAEFGWMIFIGFIWLSAIDSRSWQKPVVLGVLLALVSGLAFQTLSLSASSNYVVDFKAMGALIFPNTFDTITELRVIPFDRIISSITPSLSLGFFGILGLAVFALRHPVLAIVYGPASVFALANFLVGNRAVFYSAPMIWFGVAFLSVMIVRVIWLKMPEKWRAYRHGEVGVIAVVIAVLMGSVYWSDRVQNYVPNPTFPKDIMRGFAEAEGKLPDGAVIATWWDYGYASLLFNGYNTLHDGGKQTSPVTHYVARSLLAETQKETYAILHNLASGGLQELQDNSDSFDAAEAHILDMNISQKAPVFLVLTEQMGSWMGSISKLGMWDPKQGVPITAKGNPPGSVLNYSEMKCRPSDTPGKPICNGLNFDLQAGTIDGQAALRSVTQAKDGGLVGRNLLQRDALNVVHLADIKDKGTRVLLMHDRLARSSFHRLFHLGEIDDNYFQLVYDDYPHIRIFALK